MGAPRALVLTVLVLVEAPEHRAPVRHLEVHQAASADRPSVEQHLLARVVQVREALQVLAQQQGALLATASGESDQVALTQGTREARETPVTRVTLGIRVTHVTRVPRAHGVAQLVAQVPRDVARGADAPMNVILIHARQPVELRQPSVRPAARVVELHVLALHAPPRAAHHARPADHDQVAGLHGATIGQWVTRATRAVGRRGQAHQQQAGEALVVILVATRVPALVEILVVVLVVVLDLTRAAALVLIHVVNTADLAGENQLVQAQQRAPLRVLGGELAQSRSPHLHPNVDQPEPQMRRCRSLVLSAMYLGVFRETQRSVRRERVRDA